MIVMPSFVYGDKTYEYSVQYLSSRKKSISIHVLPDATVEVKAPEHVEKQRIVETMQKRARWVVKHLEQIQNNKAQVLPREYVSGETHFYLGRRYVLKVIPAGVDQVKLMNGTFVIECRQAHSSYVKKLLDLWYQKYAKKTFDRRIKLIISRVSWLECPPPTTVRLMTKQWGSCSPKGKISLNLNLVKAPLECIDYVLAHELCHLQEHNHSKYFYSLLDKCAPGWRPVKEKLDGMAEHLLNN